MAAISKKNGNQETTMNKKRHTTKNGPGQRTSLGTSITIEKSQFGVVTPQTFSDIGYIDSERKQGDSTMPLPQNDMKFTAAKRIAETEEFRHLLHFVKRNWLGSEKFYSQLATKPEQEILRFFAHHAEADLIMLTNHEIGHTAAAYFSGVDIDYVTIIPDLDTIFAGSMVVQADDPQAIPTSLAVWRRVLTALAGPAAEEKCSKNIGRRCCLDYAVAIFYLRIALDPAYWDYAARQTVNWTITLTSSNVLWNVIRRASTMLLENGTVSGQEFATFMRADLKPGNTPPVIKQLQRMNTLVNDDDFFREFESLPKFENLEKSILYRSFLGSEFWVWDMQKLENVVVSNSLAD
jgi:hypothetical protein